MRSLTYLDFNHLYCTVLCHFIVFPFTDPPDGGGGPGSAQRAVGPVIRVSGRDPLDTSKLEYRPGQTFEALCIASRAYPPAVLSWSINGHRVRRGDVGVRRGDVGVSRCDVGVSRGDVGVSRGDVGVGRCDVGVKRGCIGVNELAKLESSH